MERNSLIELCLLVAGCILIGTLTAIFALPYWVCAILVLIYYVGIQFAAAYLEE